MKTGWMAGGREGKREGGKEGGAVRGGAGSSPEKKGLNV